MSIISFDYYGDRQGQEYEMWKNDAWDKIRLVRDNLIKETDFTQVSDYLLTAEKKAEFTAYRQALRDLPQTYDNPDEILWPTKPII